MADYLAADANPQRSNSRRQLWAGIKVAEWVETCRGTVAPWECDTTEHFTIAYYLERVEQASATIAERLRLEEHLRTGVFPREFTLRFMRELRAGASFQVESAAFGSEPALRLGHRFVDSASGEPVTWIEEVWPGADLTKLQRETVGRTRGNWDGPAIEHRPEPPSTEGSIPSARGRVKPADLDEFGRFSLAAFVHRFTDAVIQASAAIGITDDYMKTERRGYSTFELSLKIGAAPGAGDLYLVETGIAHLGSSSIRFLHRMTDPRSGREVARLGQFGVQLDLDARRPAPLPEHIRAAAARLVLAAH
jgi:acyl-CoA thioesterase FadM